MFGKHVTKQLSAYAHGELAAAEAERVAAHLGGCAACRAEFTEVKFGIRLAESLPTVSAPAALWDAIETALVRHEAAGRSGATAGSGATVNRGAPPSSPARRFSFAGRPAFVAASVACLALCAWAAWAYLRPGRAAWEVSRLAGAPVIESGRILEKGRLGVGDWLETDSGSRARVEVANIGQVEVEPNTRVRLVETRLTEHRLELQRGTLHARIWAPPRLFFVDTPSAVAADLGCAYTLEVDDAGRSLLRVTAGWVALEDGRRESLVPAGAACVTRPGAGPGTPFFADAPEEMVAALSRFDYEGGGGEALAAVLAGVRDRDTLTLWHLLSRVEAADRERVYQRLAEFSPPPEGVTREGVLQLDRAMLDAWKGQLEVKWITEDFPAVRKAWRNLWR